jgi:tetratricopeptide (TPR) repeat protein
MIPRTALLMFLLVLLTACGRRDEYLDSLVEMEDRGYQGRQVSQERIEEIKEAIRDYRKEVARKVDATGQIGIYYKMLALEYMEAGMFQEAYEALQEAIAIHPENPILFYYSAVCAARMSKAQVEEDPRQRWLELSERLYRRAIDLDPGYADALYGLAILYVFELDRPEEAEVLLDRLLSIESENIDAMFLLARVYYRTGRLEMALELYRKIAARSKVESKREEALADQRRVEEELYGVR